MDRLGEARTELGEGPRLAAGIAARASIATRRPGPVD
jgi:hypothetical protein